MAGLELNGHCLVCVAGYLGDLNGYESEEERQWHLPGSYTLHGQ